MWTLPSGAQELVGETSAGQSSGAWSRQQVRRGTFRLRERHQPANQPGLEDDEPLVGLEAESVPERGREASREGHRVEWGPRGQGLEVWRGPISLQS